jgi:uncharacterized Tic20 family protein
MTDPTPGATPAVPLTPAEDKQWASFAHFGGVLLFVPSLIIYLVFKDRGALTRQESKEALNFQITYMIAWIALSIVVSFTGAIFAIIGLWPLAQVLDLLPFLLYLGNAALSIVGGLRVNSGGSYRYPVALRLIK